jgi:hypothetical protein
MFLLTDAESLLGFYDTYFVKISVLFKRGAMICLLV